MNCGDPGTLTNGRRFVAGTIEGSSVKFQCNHGYALRGESKRECLPNGEWSGQAPSCKRKPPLFLYKQLFQITGVLMSNQNCTYVL